MTADEKFEADARRIHKNRREITRRLQLPTSLVNVTYIGDKVITRRLVDHS